MTRRDGVATNDFRNPSWSVIGKSLLTKNEGCQRLIQHVNSTLVASGLQSDPYRKDAELKIDYAYELVVWCPSLRYVFNELNII